MVCGRRTNAVPWRACLPSARPCQEQLATAHPTLPSAQRAVDEDCEPQQWGSGEDAWPTKWPECSPHPLSRISRRNQSSQPPTPAAQVWAQCSSVWVWPQSTTTLTCPTGARAASGLPGTLDSAVMSLLVPTPAAPQWALPRSLTP